MDRSSRLACGDHADGGAGAPDTAEVARTLGELTSRLARLERRERRTRRVAGALGGALALALLGRAPLAPRALAEEPKAPAGVQDARGFRLVDKAGKVRAAFELDGEELPTLSLLDAEGKKRVFVSVSAKGSPWIALRDATEQARIVLELKDSGAASVVSLFDDRGNPQTALVQTPDESGLLAPRIALVGSKKDAGLVLRDTTGRARCLALVNEKGVPLVALQHEKDVRARWTLGADGSPSLSFLGPEQTLRLVLAAVPEEATLVALDGAGKPRLALASSGKGEPGVILRDGDGKVRAGLRLASDGAPLFVLAGKDGEVLFQKP